MKRPVRLLVSDQARVPAAMGFRHPVVVLPAWTLRDLPADRLRHILIHELAHIRRHDDWTNLVQKIARAVFFFHPAVWWIDARLSLEREMACDEAVLAATGNPRAYAGCLIDLLERGCARRGWTMAQAAVARARDASVRIARILQGEPASQHAGRPQGSGPGCRRIPGVLREWSCAAPGSWLRAGSLARCGFGARCSRIWITRGSPAPDVVPAIYHPAAARDANSVRPASLAGQAQNDREQPAHSRPRALAAFLRERGAQEA